MLVSQSLSLSLSLSRPGSEVWSGQESVVEGRSYLPRGVCDLRQHNSNSLVALPRIHHVHWPRGSHTLPTFVLSCYTTPSFRLYLLRTFFCFYINLLPPLYISFSVFLCFYFFKCVCVCVCGYYIYLLLSLSLSVFFVCVFWYVVNFVLKVVSLKKKLK